MTRRSRFGALAALAMALMLGTTAARAQVPVMDSPTESNTKQILTTVQQELQQIQQILQATQKIQMATGTPGAGGGGIGSMISGAGMGVSAGGGGLGGLTSMVSGLTSGNPMGAISGLMGGGSNPLSSLTGGSNPLSSLTGGSNPLSSLTGGANALSSLGSTLSGAANGNLSSLGQLAGLGMGIANQVGGSSSPGSSGSGSTGYTDPGTGTTTSTTTAQPGQAPTPVSQGMVTVQDPGTGKWYNVTAVTYQDQYDGSYYSNYYYQDQSTGVVTMTPATATLSMQVNAALQYATYVTPTTTLNYLGTTATGYSNLQNVTNTVPSGTGTMSLEHGTATYSATSTVAYGAVQLSGNEEVGPETSNLQMNTTSAPAATSTTTTTTTTAPATTTTTTTSSTPTASTSSTSSAASSAPTNSLSILQSLGGLNTSLPSIPTSSSSSSSSNPMTTAMNSLISTFNGVVNGNASATGAIQALQSVLYINSGTAPTTQQVEAINDMRRLNLQNAALSALAAAMNVQQSVGATGQQTLSNLANSAGQAGDIRSDLAANTSVMLKVLEQTVAQNGLLASMLHLEAASQISNDGINGRESGTQQQ